MPKNSKELFNDALSTGDHGRRDRNRKLDDTRKLDFSKVRIPLKESPVISSPLYDLVEDAGLRKPDNFLYETLSDPKLNRGIENLAGNVYDIIMGAESGNPVVDYGTSNLPGVGPASILAAGGLPGLIDFMGFGRAAMGAGNAARGLFKWKDLKEIGKLLPEVNTVADAIEKSPNRDILASLFAHGNLAGTISTSIASNQNVREGALHSLDRMARNNMDDELVRNIFAKDGKLHPALKHAIVKDQLHKSLRRANLEDLANELGALDLTDGPTAAAIETMAKLDHPLNSMRSELSSDVLEGIPQEVIDNYLLEILERKHGNVSKKIPAIEEALEAIDEERLPNSLAAREVLREQSGHGIHELYDDDYDVAPAQYRARISDWLEYNRDQKKRLEEVIGKLTPVNPRDRNPDWAKRMFSNEEPSVVPEINPEDNPLSLFYDAEKAAAKKAAEEAEEREIQEKLRKFLSGEIDRVEF